MCHWSPARCYGCCGGRGPMRGSRWPGEPRDVTLRLLEAIGTDRHLSAVECPAIATHAHGAEAWALYQSHFGGYCEAALDPLFARLRLPVPTTGRLAVDEVPVAV